MFFLLSLTIIAPYHRCSPHCSSLCLPINFIIYPFIFTLWIIFYQYLPLSHLYIFIVTTCLLILHTSLLMHIPICLNLNMSYLINHSYHPRFLSLCGNIIIYLYNNSILTVTSLYYYYLNIPNPSLIPLLYYTALHPRNIMYYYILYHRILSSLIYEFYYALSLLI